MIIKINIIVLGGGISFIIECTSHLAQESSPVPSCYKSSNQQLFNSINTSKLSSFFRTLHAMPKNMETMTIVSETMPENMETMPIVSETMPENMETMTIVYETMPENMETMPVVSETMPENMETMTIVSETMPENMETMGIVSITKGSFLPKMEEML